MAIRSRTGPGTRCVFRRASSTAGLCGAEETARGSFPSPTKSTQEEVEFQGDLQIIVLEHAYFADDERFIRAVGDRSLEVKKLIPSDWPLVTQ